MFGDMIGFVADPANWLASGGILTRIWEHFWYSLLALLFAAAIALPVGLIIGHTRRGIVLTVGVANVLRALPSLGLMTVLVLLLGLGLLPPLLALVILAIPPLLAGTYSGVANVDAVAVDAARAMGMREWRILVGVEIPNSLPLIVSGTRNAMLQIIATAMIAAYVNLGGLGRFIFDGLAMFDYGRVLVGAILTMILAVVVDGVLAFVGTLVVPGQPVMRSLARR